MTKLKMWLGNYDGRRKGLIISTSKERARKALGRCSRSEFDGYWVLQPRVWEWLDFEPDTLYTTPLDAYRHDNVVVWHKGRCEL